jgi:hypothetical protein
MPTINRTTSGMKGPLSSTVQSSIDSLRADFVAGNTITAQRINDLIGVWKSFNDHYHSVDNDLFGIYDFGNKNTGGYSTTGDYDGAKNTGAMGGFEPADVSVGDTITAAKHEELRSAFQSANDHVHTIDDRSS